MKTQKFLIRLALLAIAAFMGLQTASAKRVYVGTVEQWGDRTPLYTTPNLAITGALKGDEIWIAAGTYPFDGVSISSKPVSLYGGFAGTENSIGERQKKTTGKGWDFANPTILQQTEKLNNNSMITALSISIDNLLRAVGDTIKNIDINGLVLDGNASSAANGIYFIAAGTTPAHASLNVSIKNCTVRNFGSSGAVVTGRGGGMHLFGDVVFGSFVVDSCLIENNWGATGGGVFAQGVKTISNSTIRNNNSATGSGVYLYAGGGENSDGLTLTGCLIDGNIATSNGGGIYIRDITTKYNIHNCIVVSNTAENGSGVYFYSATTSGNDTIATISNLTIANNMATYNSAGGGIYFSRPKMRVYNCIFYNNTQSGGVKNVYTTAANAPAAFKNNIIASTTYPNLTNLSNCINNGDASALFTSDYVTLPTSPGTNKGTDEFKNYITMPTEDYAGNPRIQGTIDIGPYEYLSNSVEDATPTAPADLECTAATSTTLTIRWSKSTGDFLKGYIISFNGTTDTVKLTDYSSAILSQQGDKLCYLLTGLTQNKSYPVSVKAFSFFGSESAAASGTFSTNTVVDGPTVWYVGSAWTGRPINRVKATPNVAYTDASEGDEIWIATGTYSTTVIRMTPTIAPFTGKLVSFYGGFAGTETSIEERAKVPGGKGWEFVHPTTLKQSGTGSLFYVFNIASTTATKFTIDGLILEGLNNSGSGISWSGGTNLSNLHVSIKNCEVRKFGITSGNNSNGIHLEGSVVHGSFVIESCLIEGNKGTTGGGIQVQGLKTIKNCVIRNNETSGNGGGIYALQGSGSSPGLTITGCLISGNTAAGNGGGIYIGSSATFYNLHNCIVVNNAAANGGGVSFGTGTIKGTNFAKFTNFTIASNRASEAGAGVYFTDGSEDKQSVYNSIFWNNINTGLGELGEVENVYIPEGASPNIFSRNIIDREYDRIPPTRCLISTDSAALFGENWATKLPGLAEGVGDTAGIRSLIPEKDFAGSARIAGPSIDVGPYELEPDAAAPSIPQIAATTADATSIAISWGASTPPTGKIEVDGYYVYVDGVLASTVAGSRTKDTVRNLYAGMEYEVTVAAYVEYESDDVESGVLDVYVKASLKSKAAKVTTAAGEKPSKPGSFAVGAVTVRDDGTAFVPLSWAESLSPSGVVKGYNVYVKESGTFDHSWKEPLTTGTTYTVGYLYAGSTYEFSVEAVDISGLASDMSDKVQRTIPTGIQNVPGVGEGKNSATPYPLTITIKQTPDMKTEMDRLVHKHRKYNRQSTGIYVERGVRITAASTVEGALPGDDGAPVLYVGTLGYLTETQQTITLPASNVLTTQAGMLWLEYPATKTGLSPTGEATVTISSTSALKRAPRYVHGVTTEEEFAAMMNRYTTTPSVIFQSDYAVVVATQATARENTLDGRRVEWMNDLDGLLASEDRISGLDNTDANALHHRLPAGGIRHGIFEFVTDNFASANAYGYLHFPARNGKYFLKPFSSMSTFQITGYLWGVAHEIGHQHQQWNYLINNAVEATVNIYSYAAIRDVLKARGVQTTFNRTTAAEWAVARSKYLTGSTGSRNYSAMATVSDNGTDLNVLALRFMVWEQLYTIFGDEFYHRLHRITREEGIQFQGTVDDDKLAANDNDRKAFLIRVASQLTGYDLRNYFEAWGIRVTGSTPINNLNSALNASKLYSLPNGLTIADLIAVEGTDPSTYNTWAPLPLLGIREKTPVTLNSSKWKITLNNNLNVSGTNYKENIIDGNTGTVFTSTNKPANGGFTIDLQDTLAFDRFTYTQPSTGNNNLRATGVSLYGSNNEDGPFDFIASSGTLATDNSATATTTFTTVAYRYVKLVYNAYGSGSGVSVAEFGLGVASGFSKVKISGDAHVEGITPASPQILPRGKDVAFDFTVAESYRLKEVLVTPHGGLLVAAPAPVSQGGGKFSLAIRKVLADSLDVSVITDQPKVTVSKSEGITITSPEGVSPYTGNYRQPFTLTFKVADGYENLKVTAGGVASTPTISATNTVSIGTLTTDTAISISVTKKRFKVTTDAQEGIEVSSTSHPTSVTNVDSVPYGDDLVLKFKLSEGRVTPGVNITDGGQYTLSDPGGEGTYILTVKNVTSDRAVTITSEVETFRVTVEWDAGSITTPEVPVQSGVVPENGFYTVSYGTDFSFTYAVVTGYENATVKINSDAAVPGNGTVSQTITAETDFYLVASKQMLTVTVKDSAGIASHSVTSPEDVEKINNEDGTYTYTVEYGNPFSFSFVRKTGYRAPTVKVGSGQPVVLGDAASTYALQLPNGVTSNMNVVIYAEIETFTINLNKSPGITDVELLENDGVKDNGNNTYTVNYGKNFAISFKLSEKYENLSVSGAVHGTGENGAHTATITNVQEDEAVVLSATMITYPVSYSLTDDPRAGCGIENVLVTTGGVSGVTGSGQSYTVEHGATFTLTFKVKVGYEKPKVSIGGVDQGTLTDVGGLYTVEIPDVQASKAITITATFPTYAVTVPGNGDGISSLTVATNGASITGSGTSYLVNKGTTFSFSFTLDAGYEGLEVIVDGVKKTPDFDELTGKYTVAFAVEKEVEVTISASLQQLDVTIEATGVTIASPEGDSPYKGDYGKLFTVAFDLVTGYEKPTAKIGSTVIENPLYGDGHYSVTVESLTTDTTISITAVKQRFRVTTTQDAGIASIVHNTSVANVDSVKYEEDLTLEFTLNEGYITPVVKIGDVLYEDLGGPDGEGKYTVVVANVTTNRAVSISSTKQTFVVSITVDGKGVTGYSIPDMTGVVPNGSVPNSYLVDYDTDLKFTYTLEQGYQPATVAINGGAPSPAEDVVTQIIKAPTTFSLSAKIQQFTVTVENGEGIASHTVPITGGVKKEDDGSYTVDYGTNFAFTFELKAGYTNSKVKEGESTTGLGSSNSHTLYNVTSERNIVISAEKQTFDITVSSADGITSVELLKDGGVKDNSNGTYTVSYDSTFAISFELADGYEYPKVDGDNATKLEGSSEKYTATIEQVQDAATINLSASLKRYDVRYSVQPDARAGVGIENVDVAINGDVVRQAEGVYRVTHGVPFNLTFKVKEGYTAPEVKIGENPYTLDEADEGGVYTVEIDPVTGSAAITITATVPTFDVTLQSEAVSIKSVQVTAKAGVTGSGTDYEVNRDTVFSFSITLQDGYELPLVKVNDGDPFGCSHQSGSTYTAQFAVTEAATVAISASKQQFDVTLGEADEDVVGVTITSTQHESKVAYGEKFVLTFKLVEGYELPKVYLDGSPTAETATVTGPEVDGTYTLTIDAITKITSIKVIASKIEYEVTVDLTCIAVTLPVATPYMVQHGEGFDLKFKLKEGYETPQVSEGDGVLSGPDGDVYTVTLTNVTGSKSIVVTADTVEYEITIDEEGVTVNEPIEGSIKVKHGKALTITFTVGTPGQIPSAAITGEGGSVLTCTLLGGDVWTVTLLNVTVNTAVEIKASNECKITLTNVDSRVTVVSPTLVHDEGGDYYSVSDGIASAFVFSVPTGYEPKSIAFGGNDDIKATLLENGNYQITITATSADQTLTITTGLKEYQVSVTAKKDAIIDATPDSEIEHGSSYSLSFKLSKAYKDLVVTVNDVEYEELQGTDNEYTAEIPITGVTTINISATLKTFTVTLTKIEGVENVSVTAVEPGSISGGGPYTVEYGANVSVAFKLKPGYEHLEVLVDKAPAEDDLTLNEGTYTLSLGQITEAGKDVSLSATLKKFRITTTASSGVTLTTTPGLVEEGVNVDSVSYGGVLTHEFTLAESHKNPQVKLGSATAYTPSVAGGRFSVSINPVVSDTSIEVSATIRDYPVTLNDNNQGIEGVELVSPNGVTGEAGSYTVEHGKNITLKITLKEGYDLGSTYIGGEQYDAPAGEGGVYTITIDNVTAAKNITVNTSLRTFNVYVNSSSAGIDDIQLVSTDGITGNGRPYTIRYGSNFALTFKLKAGYLTPSVNDPYSVIPPAEGGDGRYRVAGGEVKAQPANITLNAAIQTFSVTVTPAVGAAATGGISNVRKTTAHGALESGAYTVNYDSAFAISFNVQESHKDPKVTLGTETVVNPGGNPTDGYTFRIEHITSDTVIALSATIRTFTVTANAVGEGVVLRSGGKDLDGDKKAEFIVSYGATFVDTFKLVTGYEKPVVTTGDGGTITPTPLSALGSSYYAASMRVTSNTSLSISASLSEFDVTVDAGGGITEFAVLSETESAQSPYRVKYGHEFKVQFKLAAGYNLVVTNAVKEYNEATEVYTATIASVVSNVTVNLSTSLKTYTVTMDGGEGIGQIGVTLESGVSSAGSNAYSVLHGTFIKANFALSSGYGDPKVTVGDNPLILTPNGSSYDLTFAVTADTTVHISATPIRTVTVTADQGITINSPVLQDGKYQILSGKEFSLSFTVADLYTNLQVTVDDDLQEELEDIGGVYTLTFNVTANATVNISVTPPREVTVTPGQGITIVSPEVNSQTVANGSPFSLTFTVDKGYTNPRVTINSASQPLPEPDEPGKYTVSIDNVNENKNISVNAEMLRFQVSVISNSAGIYDIQLVSDNGITGSYPAYMVSYDSAFAFTFKLRAGYINPAVNTPYTISDPDIEGRYTVDLGKITATQAAITLNAAIQTFTVAIEQTDGIENVTKATAHGTYVDAKTYTVSYDSAFAISFDVLQSHKDLKVTLGADTEVTPDEIAANSYAVRIEKVTSDTVIKLSAAIRTFTVTTTAGEGVVLRSGGADLGSGIAAHVVSYGAASADTFRLATGYETPVVTTGGGGTITPSQIPGGLYAARIAQVTSNASLSISASIRKFTVGVAAGAGITDLALVQKAGVTGDQSPYTVEYGREFAVTFELAAGYTLQEPVSGAEIAYDEGSKLYTATIASVTSAAIVSLATPVKTSTVTVTVAEGASIGNVIVPSKLGVTGGSVANTYTVNYDTAIVVTFTVPDKYRPQVTVGGNPVTPDLSDGVYALSFTVTTNTEVILSATPPWTVTVAAGAGITGVAPVGDSHKVIDGGVFSLTFTLGAYYTNPQVTVGGSPVTPVQNDGVYTVAIASVTSDTEVSLSATPPRTVKVAAGAGVTGVAPAGVSHTVADGGVFSLTFTLGASYTNPQVAVGNNSVTPDLSDGVYALSFTVTSDTTVTISATLVRTVTVTAGEGVTGVTPTGASHKVPDGSTFSLTFTLSSGYENPLVKVGGVEVTPTQSGGVYAVTIASVTTNVTVDISATLVVVTPVYRTVTVAAGTGITIADLPTDSKYTVADGTGFSLTFTVSSGYENPLVKVGDNSVTPTQSGGVYTVAITSVTADVTVDISATPVVVTPPPVDNRAVTVTAGEGITDVTPAGTSHTVTNGSSFSLTFTLSSGYENPLVKVGDNSVTPVQSGGVYTVAITSVTADVTVDISATPVEVTPPVENRTVTVVAGTGIMVADLPTDSKYIVSKDSAFSLTFTVSSGYEKPQVTVGDVAVDSIAGVYTVAITSVTADVTVDISATPVEVTPPPVVNRTVTVTAGTGITGVTPAGSSHTVTSGSAFSLTFTLSSGYEKPRVTVGGAEVTPTKNGNVYTVAIPSITADVTIIISATAVPTGVGDADANDVVMSVAYYNLYGREVRKPYMTGVYIVKETYLSKKVVVSKRVIIVNDR